MSTQMVIWMLWTSSVVLLSAIMLILSFNNRKAKQEVHYQKGLVESAVKNRNDVILELGNLDKKYKNLLKETQTNVRLKRCTECGRVISRNRLHVCPKKTGVWRHDEKDI